MNYHSSQVANYFLELANAQSERLTIIKLLKLIYIAHGWCLATLNRDILGGEQVQAWQHGPVIPSIYHEFKSYGSGVITGKASELTFSSMDNDIDCFSAQSITPQLGDDQVKRVIDYVWSIYKQYSGFDLVNMTHQSETPWSKHFLPGVRNISIPNESIKSYYERQIDRLIRQVSNQ